MERQETMEWIALSCQTSICYGNLCCWNL